jgi:hypothetical protein
LTRAARRSAPLLFALALLAAGLPKATAAQGLTIDTRPDLTLGLVASPNPVPAGETVTYTLTVRNRRPGGGFTTTGSLIPTQTATGVRVVHNLPSGITFQSATVEAGFTCAFAAPAVTCTGGTIAPDRAATIRIAATAHPFSLPRVSTAAVDPLNTILERDESNNGASVSVAIGLPDLTPSIERNVETVYSYGVPIARRLEHVVTVHNTGPAAATGVTADLTLWWRDGGGPGISATGGLTCTRTDGGTGWQIAWQSWRCRDGTVPAGGAATITVRSLFGLGWGPEAALEVVVDPVVAVLESNEGNNRIP